MEVILLFCIESQTTNGIYIYYNKQKRQKIKIYFTAIPHALAKPTHVHVSCHPSKNNPTPTKQLQTQFHISHIKFPFLISIFWILSHIKITNWVFVRIYWLWLLQHSFAFLKVISLFSYAFILSWNSLLEFTIAYVSGHNLQILKWFVLQLNCFSFIPIASLSWGGCFSAFLFIFTADFGDFNNSLVLFLSWGFRFWSSISFLGV